MRCSVSFCNDCLEFFFIFRKFVSVLLIFECCLIAGGEFSSNISLRGMCEGASNLQQVQIRRPDELHVRISPRRSRPQLISITRSSLRRLNPRSDLRQLRTPLRLTDRVETMRVRVPDVASAQNSPHSSEPEQGGDFAPTTLLPLHLPGVSE